MSVTMKVSVGIKKVLSRYQARSLYVSNLALTPHRCRDSLHGAGLVVEGYRATFLINKPAPRTAQVHRLRIELGLLPAGRGVPSRHSLNSVFSIP